ncbi:hypothetical protein E3N88_13272 [Mikania micrantha]|uniref:Uncharacterized protein n=1 Tax=Mikania micrantha TaxID=192012 RepID=A0A5N6P8A6_9ASTR|nr:hypothetical protein E3N88_46011 [Mikania micrantha]KAD5961799.1 hypothetical protein E3N88_13272 [Mikania micrantha]
MSWQISIGRLHVLVVSNARKLLTSPLQKHIIIISWVYRIGALRKSRRWRGLEANGGGRDQELEFTGYRCDDEPKMETLEADGRERALELGFRG